MTASLELLSGLVWVAVTAVAISPIILFVLLIHDLRKGEQW